MQLKLIFLLCLFFVSCAQTEKKEAKPEKDIFAEALSEGQTIRILQKQLNKQAQLLEVLKQENQKLRLRSVHQIVAEKEAPTSVDQDYSENLTGSLGETKLFGSFINAMNSQSYEKAKQAYNLLRKAYPKSDYLAEAYYLRGKNYLENKQSKLAIREFNKLIEQFPNHDRAKAAMLAKAIVYRRLNLISPSKAVLQDLISKYPKSEEAKKANDHLKLMELAQNRSVQK